MNKCIAKHVSEIMEAYYEGKPIIESDGYKQSVIDSENHVFDFNRYTYSVGPTPPLSLIAKSEYRPYEPYELIPSLEKHGWKVVYHGSVYVVQSCNPTDGKIWIGDKWHKNTRQAFEELTWFDDHTPFGALR